MRWQHLLFLAWMGPFLFADSAVFGQAASVLGSRPNIKIGRAHV